jgi:hypothetical protein
MRGKRSHVPGHFKMMEYILCDLKLCPDIANKPVTLALEDLHCIA